MFVGKKRRVFVGEVDSTGTSQVCPNCRTSIRKKLSDRYHVCHECGYGVDLPVDRDISAAQELCNRGIETYRGTPEKQASWLSSRSVGELCSR